MVAQLRREWPPLWTTTGPGVSNFIPTVLLTRSGGHRLGRLAENLNLPPLRARRCQRRHWHQATPHPLCRSAGVPARSHGRTTRAFHSGLTIWWEKHLSRSGIATTWVGDAPNVQLVAAGGKGHTLGRCKKARDPLSQIVGHRSFAKPQKRGSFW